MGTTLIIIVNACVISKGMNQNNVDNWKSEKSIPRHVGDRSGRLKVKSRLEG
jgi:hypothetical protein